jgi:dynein heavy chain
MGFQTKVYREQMYILTDLEYIQLDLDESLTNINSVMGNRYIKRLRDRGETLQRNLNLFSDIFDKWKECQRNWLYLENIFQSEDIRRETQQDYAEFEKVNRNWVKMMTGVNSNNKIKGYCTLKTQRELNNNNEMMDKIQKNLEKFLKSKRLAFARFFFLSNDELLQILAAAKDIK